ncbi:Glycosyltransferase like family 2 [Jatrophihabitans endophyticus]|uniref:4,4'-diaponeurosporenoate glycosyltransferase n=1 Tax=Jatrophihabitans endophyticus TaxID=1206085 RepID=A0A1M5DXE9_9ACTN|nr:glycosyltransferase [Jatrophihabitans endophyticus]SHF71708.1 Glycosyltransferase like family 2 [Jatrophihabitans endophyticus]
MSALPAIGELAVIVPAADEEASIGACLAALREAQAAVPGIPVRVVVVLDACRDDTAAVVARHPEVHAEPCAARNVGVARALGSARALELADDPTRLWLAHTDADSLVPRDWLIHMLVAAAGGADVVLGTVVPSPDLPPHLRAAWDVGHDVDDGHGHVHGANLGIRASAYVALGGWRPLLTGEDVDLAERAERARLPVHRTGGIPVVTSARLHSRAPDGFAAYLRDVG